MRLGLTNLLEPKTNSIEITNLLINALDVKLSFSTLKQELEEHPEYPSMLSISDVLKSFGVENIALKIEHHRYTEMPVPFITLINGEKDSSILFTVVQEIDKSNVRFFDPEKHAWDHTSFNDFVRRAHSVVLLAEAGNEAGELDYYKRVKEEKSKKTSQLLIAGCVPMLVLCTAIWDLTQFGTAVLFPLIFMLINLSGAIFSALLILYEIDQYNPALQKICSAGKQFSCNAILQSRAAKIGGISWSVIGFSYFMGGLLLLLFSGTKDGMVLSGLAWLNVFALPYIIFSVYYQWQIAKQWCALCLCVQALLLLQAIVGFSAGWHQLLLNDPTKVAITSFIAAFIFPFVCAIVLQPALHKAKEMKQIKADLQRLKHNSQMFELLLSKQKAITESTQGLGIVLGNPNSTNRIIKVCNPYCGPCAKAHVVIEDLLQNNENLQIQILFTSTSNDGDIRMPPVRHLLAISEKGDEIVTKRALADWYKADIKDYEEFAIKYPLNGELSHQSAKIDYMADWCEKTGIGFTPTFFVNGNQLPELYNIDDLKYFFTQKKQ